MKKILITFLFASSSILLKAQMVFPDGFSNAFNTVLRDYTKKFQDTRGAIKLSTYEFTRYESWIKIPGSDFCLIDDYTSKQKFSIYYLEKQYGMAEEDYASFISGFSKLPLLVSIIKNDDPAASRNEGYSGSPGARYDYKKATFISVSSDPQYRRLTITVRLYACDWPNAQMMVSINSGE